MRDIFAAWACITILVTPFLAGQSLARIDLNSIVGAWLFDEGGGDVARDSSGNGLDGKLVNSPKWVDGKFGKALEFNGVDNYVEVPPFENPTKAVTVTAWVKSNTPTWNTAGWIVAKRPAFVLHPRKGTKTVLWVVSIAGGWNTPHGWRAGEVGPDDITEWHMYTCTFDSSTGDWKIYIDGEEKSSLSCDKAEIKLDNGPLYIGLDPCCGRRFGNGVVDEVAIFNVALSKEDINEIMNKGLGKVLRITAVSPSAKLAVTWGDVKSR
jgi:hypothetical protein